MMSRVAVLGGGSWGTSLACLLASKGEATLLWVRTPEAARRMRESRQNPDYLPGITLPSSLSVTSELDDVRGSPLAVLAVPTAAQREVARRLRGTLCPDRVLCAAKGYEERTRLRMSEVLLQELGPSVGIAILAGPSHAEEVALGIPTTVVVASSDENVAIAFQELLFTPAFRVYTNVDVLGVETAAALKNVIAIAAGICDGLGFGDNTKGALVTRGLAEISRLGEALGARAETFFGLAGIGDLVTTCISSHSRNRKVGELVARGRSLAQASRETGQVAEGVATTRAALAIAEKARVELPITAQVAAVLFDGKSPRSALGDLMGRDAKAEVR
jgi:glycerol-3-phosphate dehydrogenase (NAD(P)+)